jgi:chromosome partitioning protein
MSNTLKAPRIIAITNQKGGVGKTTTSINLAAGLTELGARVLLVDLDPQGNASTGLGVEPADRKSTTYDLLIDLVPISEVVMETSFENLYLCPANSDLSSADIDMASSKNRSSILKKALRSPDIDQYNLDYVLIDCPPSLSLLTLNAMIAAHSVLVPLQCEFFALEGLSQLMLTIREVRQNGNEDLRIEGVVMTMYDSRNRLSLLVENDARQTLGDLVFKAVIPRNVRVSEAPSFAQSVLTYDPQSKGSEAYRALAAEVFARRSKTT